VSAGRDTPDVPFRGIASLHRQPVSRNGSNLLDCAPRGGGSENFFAIAGNRFRESAFLPIPNFDPRHLALEPRPTVCRARVRARG